MKDKIMVVAVVAVMIVVIWFLMAAKVAEIDRDMVNVTIPFCVQLGEERGIELGITIETYRFNSWMSDCCGLLVRGSRTKYKLFNCTEGSPCDMKDCLIDTPGDWLYER